MKRRPLVLAGIGLLLAPLIGELGYRGLCRLQGLPYSADSAEREILRTVASMNQPVPTEGEEPVEAEAHVAHPYYGFEGGGAHRTIAGQLAQLPKWRRAGDYLVLVVGGSVAGMLSDLAGDHLAKRLQADPRLEGRRVRVLGHGRGGFKQPQQQMLVGFLFDLGLVPDAVVNVDGFNEVALGNHNATLGAHPLYPHWPRFANTLGARGDGGEALDLAAEIWFEQRRARELAERAVDGGWTRSALLGRWVASRVRGMREHWGVLQRRYVQSIASGGEDSPLHGPSLAEVQASPVELCVQGWSSASRALRAVCEDRGVLYVHVLQPTMPDEGSKPLTEEEVAGGWTHDPWREGARAGYPLLREAGAELRDGGVSFVDASLAFSEVTETLYVDVCHYNRRGNRLLADRVAEGLLAAMP